MQIGSIPALILMAAQIGFAALARSAGLDAWEAMALTLLVWALPSQVVFVGVVSAGASLPATMLAVGLSSVRFLPMVMAWTPVVRGARTRTIELLFLSWFVAITAWVFAMSKLPELDREARAPFFAGFGITLTVANTAIVGVAHDTIGRLPDVAAGALVFLTPVYFTAALWGAARHRADQIALGTGLVLGPIATALAPGADILIAGVAGGVIAYGLARLGPKQPL